MVWRLGYNLQTGNYHTQRVFPGLQQSPHPKAEGAAMMSNQLQDLLGLRVPPIAVTFQETAPANVPRVEAAGPSSCAYWKRAAAGQTFYTEATDHYNCPIGGYTHGVVLPPAQMQELQGVVETMINLGYLRAEEVPNVPRRETPFRVAVYAPLSAVSSVPDVVLVRGNARQLMLLEEAVQAANVGGSAALMGRPTCAALAATLRSDRAVSSLGCIGNRVYTDLGDDEFYYFLPGPQLNAVVAKLEGIVHANRELEKYHQARLA
jgi:uncharacterized protein (DUF169 family)